MHQQFFVITGMHRSHTSLLASMLGRTGISLHRELVGANTSNPYGHFEDIPMLSVIKSILDDNGAKWFRNIEQPLKVFETRENELAQIVAARFEELGPQWGFKTPQSTLVLDALAKHETAKFVFIYRDPYEVISSLLRRMRKQIYWRPDAAFLFAKAYAVYNERIADFYEANTERCYIISSDNLQKDPVNEIKKMADFFQIKLINPEVAGSLVRPETISAPNNVLARFYTDFLSRSPRVRLAFERMELLSQRAIMGRSN